MPKKSTSKKRKTSKTPKVPPDFKPTLLIDSNKTQGNHLKVGKKAKVIVSGRIVEESLRNYEAKGRKSYRLEVDKIIIPKRKK